ncbi:MAG: hypothetical protein ACUVTL_08150 [Thermoproteota archaeon]
MVTIDCVNTGSRSTSIDLIMLNGVPTSDYVPVIVLGRDFDTLPLICETGAHKIGTLKIQFGATDPSGNRLDSGSTLVITLHTTNGEKYPATITLP